MLTSDFGATCFNNLRIKNLPMAEKIAVVTNIAAFLFITKLYSRLTTKYFVSNASEDILAELIDTTVQVGSGTKYFNSGV